jgi:hypothetical protein
MADLSQMKLGRKAIKTDTRTLRMARYITPSLSGAQRSRRTCGCFCLNLSQIWVPYSRAFFSARVGPYHSHPTKNLSSLGVAQWNRGPQ